MRRLMAQEVADAKARGEILEETSASDWSSADDEDNADKQQHSNQGAAAASNSRSQDNGGRRAGEGAVGGVNLRVPSTSANRKKGYETGNEADMDDTSVSSRGSSRMLESVNSMNVM